MLEWIMVAAFALVALYIANIVGRLEKLEHRLSNTAKYYEAQEWAKYYAKLEGDIATANEDASRQLAESIAPQ